MYFSIMAHCFKKVTFATTLTPNVLLLDVVLTRLKSEVIRLIDQAYTSTYTVLSRSPTILVKLTFKLPLLRYPLQG